MVRLTLSIRFALIRLRNETFDFPIGPSTPKLYVSIFDHKTLGKDKALGDADIDVSNKYVSL